MWPKAKMTFLDCFVETAYEVLRNTANVSGPTIEALRSEGHAKLHTDDFSETTHPSALATTRVSVCFSWPTSTAASAGVTWIVGKICTSRATVYATSNSANSSVW